MAQGDNKTGQKGTHSVFVMTHKEIDVAEGGGTQMIVVDHRPQKEDPDQIRIAAGGKLITYKGSMLTCTADLTTSKLLWNSMLSTEGAKYMYIDIKNFYLMAALDYYEYMKIPPALFPEWIKHNIIWTLTQEMVLHFWKSDAQSGASHRQVYWQTNYCIRDSNRMGITNASTRPVFGAMQQDQLRSPLWSTTL